MIKPLRAASVPSGRHTFRCWFQPTQNTLDEERARIKEEQLASGADDLAVLISRLKNLTLQEVPYAMGPPPVALVANGQPEEVVLGVHFGHDAHVAVTIGGDPLLVFELEVWSYSYRSLPFALVRARGTGARYLFLPLAFP
jgi:hypothetical protein